MNFKDRTGEEIINKQGLKMTIIRYGTSKDIDIMFEDGVILYNKYYKDFKRGSIINDIYTKRIRESETIINTQGILMKIKEYRSADDIDVEFEDGYIAFNRQYVSFKKGSISNPNFMNSRTNNRVGEETTLLSGLKAKIIEYRTAKDIDVEIYSTKEIIKNCTYRQFKTGEIKSHFSPTVVNVGIVGNNIATEEQNKTIAYTKWSSMLNRVILKNNVAYQDKDVCEEWLIYENFLKWHNKNYYEVEGETMCLDKDILCKGNKIYSPETCIYVPERINILFVKSLTNKGDYPIGVVKNGKKYNWQLSKKDRRIRGYGFNTPEEAFYGYKQAKEQYIKEVAEEYKDRIPQKLYEAMYKYEVEITD